MTAYHWSCEYVGKLTPESRNQPSDQELLPVGLWLCGNTESWPRYVKYHSPNNKRDPVECFMFKILADRRVLVIESFPVRKWFIQNYCFETSVRVLFRNVDAWVVNVPLLLKDGYTGLYIPNPEAFEDVHGVDSGSSQFSFPHSFASFWVPDSLVLFGNLSDLGTKYAFHTIERDHAAQPCPEWLRRELSAIGIDSPFIGTIVNNEGNWPQVKALFDEMVSAETDEDRTCLEVAWYARGAASVGIAVYKAACARAASTP
jgi:hypothetical protein